ncbi:1-acyl-sn-glycerol-3-phosphate acyltransferase [Candidatus Blochmanniella vafra str. BVAF]|uniref:1-acyl-sn-glycerol-3-phosphate acyltransferase n=1 Tax=Blochmanniella vafra (strain BVAF) TaxID=859654 RepID=E8Q6N6_BLOVB|nr:1-acylglycerol-3-phosphate O-acyltransferase [Candidatus Blochmannia vafer]ADV33477.1 1-acyl-sn-glycerol-3-phosphate acyltransferase [Candidatus Blochmannia vafer str. BVAF]
MIAIIRVVLILIISINICVFGIIYCLLVPRQLRYIDIFSHLFGCMAPIFGIQLEIRKSSDILLPKNCVYISNHQNNYDMVTVSSAVQSNTVTIGKKNLLWIPLFGQLYWLSGNILIDRTYNSVQKTRSILTKIIKTIRIDGMSVWIFPEGTRNQGRGLLPFKIGAFYAAIFSKVPIVPICVSDISNNKIRLNRWSNGLVIIEIMPSLKTCQYKLNQVRIIAAHCHKIMKLKIDKLNEEVMLREN